MCSNQSPLPSPNMASTAPVIPYTVPSVKHFEGNTTQNAHQFSSMPTPSGLLPIDQYRLQLYNYAVVERLRFSNFGHYNSQLPFCPGYPYNPRLALQMSLFHNRVFQPEEPKPQHSYIGLIAMAILSSPEGKLVLSDIYQYILDNYPYFRTRGPGWRNSIRHNLSLNDCFVKAGRSANGKGHYWAIHPANVDDFKKGDFRRRKAQRKVRKHMGLAVDEEGDDSPSPPPVTMSPPPPRVPLSGLCPWPTVGSSLGLTNSNLTNSLFPPIPSLTRKRQFDVASLLAPDDEKDHVKLPRKFEDGYLSSADEIDDDIDVVSEDLTVPGLKRLPQKECLQDDKKGEDLTENQRIFVKDLSLMDSRQGSTPSPVLSSSQTSLHKDPSGSPLRPTSPCESNSPRDWQNQSPQLPFWIRQSAIIHPTAMLPPATLSFMEHQQQIVNRLYEQRLAAAQQQQRLLQQQTSVPDDLSPINLKNDET
ncbi:hypothetical protein RUM43_000177 [Polyplax serrata]|uniref:Fork-head domain-containing protein n=1 Tax=Polyplax serrata TaxID=468196 RepID=A0AAN8SF60_POLSC